MINKFKCLNENNDLIQFTIQDAPSFIKNNNVIQSLGYADKNGKELFEGDFEIVKKLIPYISDKETITIELYTRRGIKVLNPLDNGHISDFFSKPHFPMFYTDISGNILTDFSIIKNIIPDINRDKLFSILI